jgi:hypothetical protein
VIATRPTVGRTPVGIAHRLHGDRKPMTCACLGDERVAACHEIDGV